MKYSVKKKLVKITPDEKWKIYVSFNLIFMASILAIRIFTGHIQVTF